MIAVVLLLLFEFVVKLIQLYKKKMCEDSHFQSIRINVSIQAIFRERKRPFGHF